MNLEKIYLEEKIRAKEIVNFIMKKKLEQLSETNKNVDDWNSILNSEWNCKPLENKKNNFNYSITKKIDKKKWLEEKQKNWNYDYFNKIWNCDDYCQCHLYPKKK